MTVNHNPMFPPEVPFPERISPQAEQPSPPVPMIYEEERIEGMTLRAYAAIQLRVPDSGIKWLDKMIQRSRELDHESGR